MIIRKIKNPNHSKKLENDIRTAVVAHRSRTRNRNVVKNFRNAHPLCQFCLSKNLLVAAHEIHHIHSLSGGGETEDYNLLALCRDCHHDISTAKEPMSIQEQYSIKARVEAREGHYPQFLDKWFGEPIKQE